MVDGGFAVFDIGPAQLQGMVILCFVGDAGGQQRPFQFDFGAFDAIVDLFKVVVDVVEYRAFDMAGDVLAGAAIAIFVFVAVFRTIPVHLFQVVAHHQRRGGMLAGCRFFIVDQDHFLVRGRGVFEQGFRQEVPFGENVVAAFDPVGFGPFVVAFPRR